MAIELDFVPANYDFLSCQNEDTEPTIFRLDIKRPKGDFFSYEEMITFFEISPAMFVTLLRENKKIIQLYSSELTKDNLSYFYNTNNEPSEVICILFGVKFHYLEVRELRYKCIEEKKSILTTGVQYYLGEIWGDSVDFLQDESRSNCQMNGTKKELNHKAKRSYLAVIAALCNKSQRLDITSSGAVSIIQAEIEKIGLKLGDDTIRKIIKEVQNIMNE